MSNKQKTNNIDIFQQAQERTRRFAAEQARIKAVMGRQTQRDIAAAQGQIIPFTKADII
jgi:hypothetical protein